MSTDSPEVQDCNFIPMPLDLEESRKFALLMWEAPGTATEGGGLTPDEITIKRLAKDVLYFTGVCKGLLTAIEATQEAHRSDLGFWNNKHKEDQYQYSLLTKENTELRERCASLQEDIARNVRDLQDTSISWKSFVFKIALFLLGAVIGLVSQNIWR